MFSKFFSNVNPSAIIWEPETHPEARTFKQYSEDLEKILADIRQQISDADSDPGFKRAAEAMEKAIPLGKIMESQEPLESGRTEYERNSNMKKAGDGGLITVTGNASKLLAERFIMLLQKFINKEYWPDQNCRTDLGGYWVCSFFNQSYRSTYAMHFDQYLAARYQDNIKTLESRIKNFDERNQENNTRINNCDESDLNRIELTM